MPIRLTMLKAAGGVGRFGGREWTVALLGGLALFVICSLAAGYLNSRVQNSWGVVEEVGTGRRLPFNSRVAPGTRYAFVSVTPTGAATGVRPGDVIDMTGWTLRQRLAFAYPSTMQPFRVTLERDGQSIALGAVPVALATNRDYSRISDVTLRLLLLCSGLLIVQYGHGLATLAAGVYLVSVSMADSPLMTFAGLPPWIETSGPVLAALGRLSAYGARFTFAMQLLRPRARWVEVAMWAVFGLVFLTLLVLVASDVGALILGAPALPVPAFVLPAAQLLMQGYSVSVFAGAALLAPKSHRFAIRIIFFATLITAASYIIQEGFILAGRAVPGWMFWYFNSALLGVAVGYPWAVFARRIAGVDFIISRGVAYAISIGLIVVAVNLVETVVEQLASGWIAGVMLDYGVPVALGLSLNWVQGRVTALLERILDHDLLNTAQELQRLRSEMPTVSDIGDLAGRVAQALARSLRAERVAVYREGGDGSLRVVGAEASAATAGLASVAAAIPADDPAAQGLRAALTPVEPGATCSVLGGGLLLPLVVLGRIVGALHCGERAYSRGYDRAERAVLEDFARDLAIAFVSLDPRSPWRNLPAVAQGEPGAGGMQNADPSP